jgi:hypothetical protein
MVLPTLSMLAIHFKQQQISFSPKNLESAMDIQQTNQG